MWFCAQLYLTLIPDSDKGGALLEERYVLIDALDQAEARSTALLIGRDSEHSYISSDGNSVALSFLRIGSIYEILDDNIESGTEVFSRFIDWPEPGNEPSHDMDQDRKGES
jgi:hypothetical protein